MAVFTIISVVEQNNGGKTNISDYNGFYQTNPRLSFLMTLAMFSLGGIPPFAGMFSKFFIFMSGVNGADINTTMGAWAYGVVFIALLNTVISLYYYLKIVKAMYIVRTDNPLPTSRVTVTLSSLWLFAWQEFSSSVYAALYMSGLRQQFNRPQTLLNKYINCPRVSVNPWAIFCWLWFMMGERWYRFLYQLVINLLLYDDYNALSLSSFSDVLYQIAH